MGPQDRGWYLALLVFSTIIATYAAYWWIKKKGLMPIKVD